MKSLMTDTETLDTGPNAAVISIGIAAFDQDQGIIASEGWAINPIDWHGDVNPQTVVWWSKQNECAREYSFNGKTSALQAALGLKQFVATYGSTDAECEIWANDPDFDVVILRSWWKRVAAQPHGTGIGPFPFHYRSPRSCRTMFAEAKRLGIFYGGAWANGSVAHNPVDDACNQARAVIQIRNNLIGATP